MKIEGQYVPGAPVGVEVVWSTHLLAHPERLRIVTGLRARSDAAARYELIAHHGEVEGTAVAQGVALVENRLRSAGVRIPAR